MRWYSSGAGPTMITLACARVWDHGDIPLVVPSSVCVPSLPPPVVPHRYVVHDVLSENDGRSGIKSRL